MARQLRNGWSDGNATEDGIYLRAFDEDDEDEDGDEYHLIGGKWYKNGNEWFCSGGVWKKTGDLPGEATIG